MRSVPWVSQVLNRFQRRKLLPVSENVSALKDNKDIHISSQQQYPAADPLPMPPNIDVAETTRFSRQRNRDISATAILSHQSVSISSNIDITMDRTYDPHVESYDCFGAVALNSSMQSNVPNPFGGMHKFTHLNMPGGQWSQENKFMSHDLQSSHYVNLRSEVRAKWSNYDENATKSKGILLSVIGKLRCQHTNMHEQIRMFSSDQQANKNSKEITNMDEKAVTQNLSRKEQLKRAFKEYGSTVIVFHVGISLISLECFYLLVSSGIDLMPIVESLGLGSTTLSNKIAAGASTFVIAYAIHKVFAPVRISITLAATPFIVRYLRKRGYLKHKPTK